ncbi:ImmA/IrrE family metallo-endopeptidase [Candidatus Enterococcus courvalinii]|uniref:ImmA/IrrE family metallo-endopeptidase n=1 Tax=Candidatus Enterococcus courvalinii TaxID=2815329 RepID=A0ABS3HZW3_9ENTE|nr:ImmA/IrrE family metallo-endopeptidase [Enterococcus sp. MSG2901]MBO0482002.1 ImmA/IrrE family metallo-endopeptidase [Enterococcus sp. MSG2901]
MEKVKELLASHGIELVVMELEKRGYYFDDLNLMVINQNQSEEKQKQVILHELYHALNHSEFNALYSNPVFHSKMENEANTSMINYLIQENDGQFNYTSVLEEFNLGLGWECHLK